MEKREFLEKQFNIIKKSSYLMTLQAETLRHCGSIIQKEINFDNNKLKEKQQNIDVKNILAKKTVYMLYGYAIEVLLKALLLRHKGTLFDDKNKFLYDTHNLIKLSEETGLIYSIDENRLLRSLTAYIEWMGKYTFPKKKDDMVIPGKDDMDINVFESLFSRLIIEAR